MYLRIIKAYIYIYKDRKVKIIIIETKLKSVFTYMWRTHVSSMSKSYTVCSVHGGSYCEV